MFFVLIDNLPLILPVYMVLFVWFFFVVVVVTEFIKYLLPHVSSLLIFIGIFIRILHLTIYMILYISLSFWVVNRFFF